MEEKSQTIKEWLHTLPCVEDGRVLIDVRGCHPIAIVGLAAKQIETKDDMIMFVIEVVR